MPYLQADSGAGIGNLASSRMRGTSQLIHSLILLALVYSMCRRAIPQDLQHHCNQQTIFLFLIGQEQQRIAA